jgi:hypothetical protein
MDTSPIEETIHNTDKPIYACTSEYETICGKVLEFSHITTDENDKATVYYKVKKAINGKVFLTT